MRSGPSILTCDWAMDQRCSMDTSETDRSTHTASSSAR